MKARIQRLRAEIASDRAAVERHLDEIEELAIGDESSAGDLARVALALHHAYTGIEAILLRVARALEGEEPSGPDWTLSIGCLPRSRRRPDRATAKRQVSGDALVDLSPTRGPRTAPRWSSARP